MTNKDGKQRFEFGKNWQGFSRRIREIHIKEAQDSLIQMLKVESLRELSFLDVGCGSGLFSLAAHRLGAKSVHSFDFDPESVACANELKNRFAQNEEGWTIEFGDVLDQQYMSSLGRYDFVYSWGVLHHTGNLWSALKNCCLPLEVGGFLYTSIYNDQGAASQIWKAIKATYNKLPAPFRVLITGPALVQLWGPRMVVDFVRGKPFHSWIQYPLKNRGMSAWHDLLDWVGGYPFEVAKPEAVFTFFREQGFELRNLKTVGGKLGCNEFLFEKQA